MIRSLGNIILKRLVGYLIMKITVFTPTYNRAYIIENLYCSLKRQTFHDFEWLVVDDGSTDNTELIFQKWMKDSNSFPIRYYKQPNGGKCRAINRALDLANGELFFTVDSDDFLTDDALEKVVLWEGQLPKNEKFCGISGNLGTLSDRSSKMISDGKFIEGTLLNRYKDVSGERAIVFYTDIHRKYKYPEFDGEKFMTEAVAWNRMAHDDYKMRFYNDIIWIYEYKKDGLTKAGSILFLNNPRGYGLWLREKAEFERISTKQKVKMWYTFACDLSDRYDSKQIAEYIDAPYGAIEILILAHRAIRKIRYNH